MNARLSSNSARLHAKHAIELKHLRLAVLACSCGSFRRAAERLGVRHSALSRSIAQLEHLIGTTLFKRTTAGIRPTLPGRDFLSRATIILEQIDTLVGSAGDSAHKGSGQLSVGFCASASKGYLRAMSADFGRRWIEVTAMERPLKDLYDCLRSGATDVIIVPEGPPLIELESQPLWHEGIFVLLPKDHALAAREAIYWADLLDQPILLGTSQQACSLTKIIEPYLLIHDIGRRVRRHDVSRDMIHGLARAGHGVTFVLASDTEAIGPDLICRTLSDHRGQIQVCFHAHWLPANKDPALKGFLQLLAECYRSSALGM